MALNATETRTFLSATVQCNTVVVTLIIYMDVSGNQCLTEYLSVSWN